MDTPSWCLMRTNQMCTVAKWIVAMSGIVEQRLCCTLMVDRHECWCNIVVDDAVVWKQCSKQNLFLLCWLCFLWVTTTVSDVVDVFAAKLWLWMWNVKLACSGSIWWLYAIVYKTCTFATRKSVRYWCVWRLLMTFGERCETDLKWHLLIQIEKLQRNTE